LHAVVSKHLQFWIMVMFLLGGRARWELLDFLGFKTLSNQKKLTLQLNKRLPRYQLDKTTLLSSMSRDRYWYVVQTIKDNLVSVK